MLDGSLIVKPATNITVITRKPHLLNIRIWVVFLKDEQGRLEFQTALMNRDSMSDMFSGRLYGGCISFRYNQAVIGRKGQHTVAI